MLTSRQEKILNALIQEYLDVTEPVSSNLLKERHDLSISPATIRNELQELTEMGYLTQPHTSAGRVPTNKGYKYFVEITFTQQPKMSDLIWREIETAKKKIDQELALAQELINSLTHISSALRYTKIEDKDHMLEILEILGPSQTSHKENIDVMEEIIKKLDNQST